MSKAISVVLAVTALAVFGRAQEPAAPRVVVPIISYSSGDVPKGETISYIFPIRNEGNADLMITGFEGACGCEVPGVDASGLNYFHRNETPPCRAQKSPELTRFSRLSGLSGLSGLSRLSRLSGLSGLSEPL